MSNKYGQFRNDLLVALYRMVMDEGDKTFTAKEILDQGNLSPADGWTKKAYGEFVDLGLIKGPYAGGPESRSPFTLTGYGHLEAERLIADKEAGRPFVRLKTYLSKNLIAIAALIVSIIALFRSGN